MLGYHSGESCLAAPWRPSEKYQLLVVKLLKHKIGSIRSVPPPKESVDCLNLLRLLFKHNLIPRLHPSQYISIDQLVTQQIDEPFGFVLPHPRRIFHYLLFRN